MPEISATVREGSHTRKQRQKKPVRRKNRRRLILLFGICFLLLIGGVAGAVMWKMDDAINRISQPGVANPAGLPVDPAYHADKPISLVILGRDTRPETGTMLTDVMIVSVLNPKTEQVTMLSIPRDTRVKIPGYSGYHKINSVFANGEAERRQAEANGRTPEEDGASLTKKTLQELVGVPIQHYVEIDFEGFKAIVDELGGVEVNVDRKLVYDDPTDDTHINLEPGTQVLNGEQALGYVRHRHDNRGTKYFSSDYDRNRRQQEVIRAMVSKVTTFDGMTKIFNLIDVGAKHVKTDLSPEQIKGLAADFVKMNAANITTLENGAYWNAGTSYTYLPKDKLAEIRNTLQAQMELSSEMIAELNKDSVERNSATESASSSTDRPKRKKPATEASATKPAPAAKPVEEPTPAPEPQPQPEEQTPPPVEPAPTEPIDPGTTPPPDIPVPDQVVPEQPPVPDGSIAPPPDIVEQPPAPVEEQPPVDGGEGEGQTTS